MRFANLSNVTIDCMVDNRCICIQPHSVLECLESFDTLIFTPSKRSYSIIEAGNSKILKALSFFDDPFKLIREYHLTVNSLFTRESVCNSHQLNIMVETCYADIDTRTYYDYVKVETNGTMLRPNDVSISGQAEIQMDFITNNTKLVKWQVTWDIIIEPLIFEIVGYYAVYRLFSIWFEGNAWGIVLFLLVPNIIFAVLAWIVKKRKYKGRVNKFLKYFSRDIIHNCCYFN